MSSLSLKSATAWIIAFFETPQSPKPLGFFRIAISLFCIVQALLWLPDWEAFVGQYGWIQWEISRALNNPWEIHMEHVSQFLGTLGIAEETRIYVFFWVYVGALGMVAIGLLTRIFSVISWFMHIVIMASIPTFFYGLDIFVHISLFYIMVFPVSKAWSLDVKLGWVSPEATWGTGVAIRVLQVHMCFAYLSAGVGKIWNFEWWNGDILWYSMTHPFFKSGIDMYWVADYPFIPMFLGWWTLLIETLYGIGMWVPRLRVFWLLNMIALHLGIALFLGLWLFAGIMILLSVSAFGHECLRDLKQWKSERAHRTVGTEG